MTCILCANAGRTPGKVYARSTICQDCRAMLRASGREWCAAGKHAAPADDLRGSTCRACDNARRTARYRENPERERAATRRWYAANRERSIARTRAWYERNRDHVRRYQAAYRRQWRKAHPEARRLAQVAYRARNRHRLPALRKASRIRAKLRILRGVR